MQLNIATFSHLIPKKLYNTLVHGPGSSLMLDPNMPPTIGHFEYQNRRITVHITETVQAAKGTRPYHDLSDRTQTELVERFRDAFHDSEWLTPISKDATHALLIYVVEREDPYRPKTPFALAYFVDERGEKVGAGRAYKTDGWPQPPFKPGAWKESYPVEDAALGLDDMRLDG